MTEISARKILQTPLGRLSVAASDRGLVSVDFLPSKSKLADLNGSAPANKIVDDACQQLAEYFAGERRRFEIPLELVGTKFQKLVWQQIQKASFGKTVSYGDIAKAIKNPSAARAVGGAVGSNPIPIIVPCHRVMGSTGKLTGYSGGSGIPTKKKLLELEGIDYR